MEKTDHTAYVVCPYCGEKDFDLVGLKNHLLAHCDKFRKTETLQNVWEEFNA